MIWTVLTLLKMCKRITFEVITFSQIVIFLLLDFKDQVFCIQLEKQSCCHCILIPMFCAKRLKEKCLALFWIFHACGLTAILSWEWPLWENGTKCLKRFYFDYPPPCTMNNFEYLWLKVCSHLEVWNQYYNIKPRCQKPAFATTYKIALKDAPAAGKQSNRMY